jgi:alkylation response protein AidB-like acyl-CoA dehydrogenase
VLPASIRDGWQKNKSFNLERWKNLIELGVLSSNLPEKKGGLGMDQVTLALMVEEMGYAGLPEPVAEQIFLVNDVIPFCLKMLLKLLKAISMMALNTLLLRIL